MTRSKIVAFLMFTVGITCVTVFTKAQVVDGETQKSTPGGYLLCLLSVLLYAGYEVFYGWQEKVLEERNAEKAEPEERNEIMDSLLFVVSYTLLSTFLFLLRVRMTNRLFVL